MGDQYEVAADQCEIVGRPCAIPAIEWHRNRLAGCAPDDALRREYHAAWLRWLEHPDEPGARPLVSVVIPAWEAEAFIAESLRSALAQTWSPLEVVVVDDGSTIPLARTLAGSDPRVRVLRQDNGGVASARNLGLRAARGPLVHMLDADDSLHPEAVAAKMEALRRVPDAEVAFSPRKMIGENAFKRAEDYEPRALGAEDCPTRDLLGTVVRHYPFHTSATLLARPLALEVGGLDESLERVEDTRFWFQLGAAGAKAVAVDRPLSVRRLHAGGLTEDVAKMEYYKVVVALMNLRDLLRTPALWPYVAGLRGRVKGRAAILANTDDGRIATLRAEVVAAIAALAARGAASGRSSGPCLAALEGYWRGGAADTREAFEGILAEPVAKAWSDAAAPSRADLEAHLALPAARTRPSLAWLYAWVDRQLVSPAAQVRLGDLRRLTEHWRGHPYRERWDSLARLAPLGHRLALRLERPALGASRRVGRLRMRLRIRSRLRGLLRREPPEASSELD